VIALSCGIKISAVHHLDLSQISQSMRVTDRLTDRITSPKTALAYARAVKKRVLNHSPSLFEAPRTEAFAWELLKIGKSC